MGKPEEIKADVYLEFIENHLPSLKAGKYRFTVQQTLSGTGIGLSNSFSIPNPVPDQDRPEPFRIKVEGERFSINPAEIVSVFPPNHSLGHYANVLPHIAFKRDTLPWERMLAMSTEEADEKRLEKAPWLVLLVLNEDEFFTDDGVAPQSVTERQQAEEGYTKSVEILKGESTQGAHWPPHLDEDEKEAEKFKVIYVQKDTLTKLLPNAGGLTWLSHARKSRIKLEGIAENQKIELFNEKGKLIHEALASSSNCSLDFGELPAGDYTIKVDNTSIDDQPLKLKPSDQIGGETAVVVANRLPQPGVKSIIHLVSLEDRYTKNGTEFTFDFEGYSDAVPLVSLHSWQFSALTEKETFRHILLHLNHQFLFGINTDQLPTTLTIDSLKSGFLAGRHPLGHQAEILDTAVNELQDKDHHYFIGSEGAVYNAAGRLLTEGTGSPPADKNSAISLIPDHRLHEDSAKYSDVTARHLWIADAHKQYFVSEDLQSKRFLIYLLPSDDTPSLRLPSRQGKQENLDEANRFLKQGYVPLPHYFRRGGKSISWYRSPLLPGKPNKQIPDRQFPINAADELLRYDSAYGMFDASYSAAWELGRLLCLNNKRVSTSLYRWKRTHVRLLKIMEQQHLHPHLPFRANDPEKIVLPDNVEKWLSEISLLKGIPFNYLVPDERMLPIESIRFFYLDPSWIDSLIDGALSIGRVNKGHDTAVHKQALLDSENVGKEDFYSGFLLRSSVVKGWPNLQVNAYKYRFGAGSDLIEDHKNENIPETEDNELVCLRFSRLADNVLFGLFKGDIQVLDIHEKPETIHLGFDILDSGQYAKFPIKADGHQSDTSLPLSRSTGYFSEETRTIQPDILAKALQEIKPDLEYEIFTSAQFALCLIEGISRVRFIKSIS